jgi:uncharacterized hydrophobic protein (TIGR00271 family)
MDGGARIIYDDKKNMKRPNIFAITQQERKQAIDSLIEQSSPKFDYFLLLTLAIFIVVPGLFLDNASIIIGAMVVAPLLSSILSLALGVTIADFDLIIRSARAFAIAIAVTIAVSFVMTLFYHGATVNGEIVSRALPSLSYLIVAIASGVAASFALVRPNLSVTLPGIAVSVSLLPAIAVTGIGIAQADAKLITGSLALFGLNLLGIIFSAIVIFSLFGFFVARKESEKKLEQEQQEANGNIKPQV